MSTINEIKNVLQILQNGGKITKVIDFYNDNGDYLGELEIYLRPTDRDDENKKRGKRTMKKITFKYKDAYTHGKWSTQTCCVSSIQECINLYGLNQPDVEYRIVEVKEI